MTDEAKTYRVVAFVKKTGTATVSAASMDEADWKADHLNEEDFDWHWPADGDFYVVSVEEEGGDAKR